MISGKRFCLVYQFGSQYSVSSVEERNTVEDGYHLVGNIVPLLFAKIMILSYHFLTLVIKSVGVVYMTPRLTNPTRN